MTRAIAVFCRFQAPLGDFHVETSAFNLYEGVKSVNRPYFCKNGSPNDGICAWQPQP